MKTAMNKISESDFTEPMPGFKETCGFVSNTNKYEKRCAVITTDKFSDYDTVYIGESGDNAVANNVLKNKQLNKLFSDVIKNISFIEDLGSLGCASADDLGNLAKIIKLDIMELAADIL